ncbi:MAG: M20 family metallopeptidase [Candidatus Bathyarchaeia archaeon]
MTGSTPYYKTAKLISAIQEYHEEIGKRTHPLCGKNVCSVTMIRGGTKENVIPESCRLAIDRRIIPGETVEQVDREIEAIIRKLNKEDLDFKCEFEKVMFYESAEIPTDHEIAEVVRKNVKEVTGVTSAPARLLASTDQRNFINDAGIPAISWGPGWMKSHELDEYVKISQVVDCVKILVLTIFDLLG